MTQDAVQTMPAKPAGSQGGYKHQGGKPPPQLAGGLPVLGHMLMFARNPYGFLKYAHDHGGEVVSFKMLNQDIVLLTGPEASNAFYRAPDEQLDQSAAYKLMTPIFGEGIVFDAPIERKNEQLRMLMPSLMIDAMKGHSGKIVQEVEDIISDWGDVGEIDAVEFFKQLTINTASHCLLGKEFRYEVSEEFAHIYHDLEKGVNPIAYHYPNLPLPAFRKRDKARARLQQLVGGIIQRRKAKTDKPHDMFQTLIDASYKDGTKLTDNEITGMLLGAIFAGHHTSSGTSAWVLLELLKQPQLMAEVVDELNGLFGEDGEVTFQSLREVPLLENVLKEVLRLHPPLIVLMRQVDQDLKVGQYTVKKGDMVWAAPPVTQRIPEYFKDPELFDPHRFDPERAEDKNLDAYQPFGGGKHKCSGNAFALFQIKAIFCILLRRYEFELVEPADTYVDDYTQMIVQPKAPCRIRYRRKKNVAITEPKADKVQAKNVEEKKSVGKKESKSASIKASADEKVSAKTAVKKKAGKKSAADFEVVVDRQLCQGHAVCMGEAPEVFNVDEEGVLHIASDEIKVDLLEKAENAVRFCPNKALSIKSK